MPEPTNPILNVTDVVALEQRIAAAGTPLATLMRAAGEAVAKAVQHIAPEPCSVCVLAGPGNNGGDGWVAAEFLDKAGYQVSILCPASPASIEAQPAHDAAAAAIAATEGRLQVLVSPNNGAVTSTLHKANVVVDALLGTGFNSAQVRPVMAGWIDRANSTRGLGTLKIVSVDVPSGLSAQSGTCAETCIRADATVTMMVLKPGLLTPVGTAACGATEVASICDLAPFQDFIDSVAVKPKN